MVCPTRENPPRALLTVPEVALMLGCGRTLVYDLIGSRQLPIVKVGRLTRVPVTAVDDFVRQHLINGSEVLVGTRSFASPVLSKWSRGAIADGAIQARLFEDVGGR
jgi:excisionase family DNA binding protein